VTINSRSRKSSTILMAVSVRAVRPVVSMNVRWREVDVLTRGTVVLYWMFLGRLAFVNDAAATRPTRLLLEESHGAPHVRTRLPRAVLAPREREHSGHIRCRY
jgi:hypothetical protein